jgi:hypothetical protein
MPVAELLRAKGTIRTPIDDLAGQWWRASTEAERIALQPTYWALALGFVALWKEAQKAAYYASSNAYLTYGAIANPGAASSDDGYSASRAAEERSQAELLRCIFGNPSRHTSVQASWLAWILGSPSRHRSVDASCLAWNGGAVVKVAQAIYDDRAFERLTLRADALEDAGCTDPELLGHLRGPGPHVRGCWAVDLVLGKS